MTKNLKYLALAMTICASLLFSNAYAEKNRFKLKEHIVIDTQLNI